MLVEGIYLLFWCQIMVVKLGSSQAHISIVTVTTMTAEVFDIKLRLVHVLLYSTYSVGNNGLTATGAIALVRALEQNKSLEELK